MLTDDQIIEIAQQEFRDGVFHNGPSRYVAFARAILAASTGPAVKVYPQGVMGIPPYEPPGSSSHGVSDSLTYNGAPTAAAARAGEKHKPPPWTQAEWNVGRWLSAALEDEYVCAEMKRDIRAWFDELEAVAPFMPAAAQEFVNVPPGLTREEKRQLILDHAPAAALDERGAFEAAWRRQYPEHAATFMKSCIDPDRYVNTRVQDGWLMWQARAAASPVSGAFEAVQALLREVDPKWRDRGEFGVKPVEQALSAIRDLAAASPVSGAALQPAHGETWHFRISKGTALCTGYIAELTGQTVLVKRNQFDNYGSRYVIDEIEWVERIDRAEIERGERAGEK
jgi:hypothetical protein